MLAIHLGGVRCYSGNHLEVTLRTKHFEIYTLDPLRLLLLTLGLGGINCIALHNILYGASVPSEHPLVIDWAASDHDLHPDISSRKQKVKYYHSMLNTCTCMSAHYRGRMKYYNVIHILRDSLTRNCVEI